ncbi:MAG: hypothetical protein ACI4U3_04315 [Traorella sp.]
MTIDEAIEHCEEIVNKKYAEGMLCHANPNDKELDRCIECANQHEQLKEWLEELKVLRKVNKWIPITYHETTDDDGIDKEQFPLMLDCALPEDDTEIIVCTKCGGVFADTFFNDDGCYLESGFDIIKDVIAWMPLPEPYKGSE